jgi:D-alanyl-D-alanine dipeptidase
MVGINCVEYDIKDNPNSPNTAEYIAKMTQEIHSNAIVITKRLISQAKVDGAKIVIVSFHYGMEGSSNVSNFQITLSHSAVDFGADIVLGTHTHRLQGIEQYQGKYIVYGLSNFVFGGILSFTDVARTSNAMDTMLFGTTFMVDTKTGKVDIKDAYIVPYICTGNNYFNNYQPIQCVGSEAKRIKNKILNLSKPLAYGIKNINMLSEPQSVIDNSSSKKATGTTSISPPIQVLPKDAEQAGLVFVSQADPTIVIDLRYATTNNFTGKPIYKSSLCMIEKNTMEKLKKANEKFAKMGLRIKIWDAYRPLSAQQILWDAAPDDKKSFLANPKTGSRHNRGVTVDLTLVDSNGNELDMPSGFDDFSSAAYRSNTAMTAAQRKNLATLTTVMTQCGFNTLDSEWWHYEDSNYKNYPLLDILF